MKTIINLILLLLIVNLSWAQKQDYSFEENYKTSESPRFILDARDGNVSVFPHDKNEVQIYFIVKKGNTLQKISRDELPEEMALNIDNTKEVVTIKSKNKSSSSFMNWDDQTSISFEIYVPKGTSCMINASDGNVAIAGLSANQTLELSDGNLGIKSINGNVKATLSDGNIACSNINGNIKMISSDGNLAAENIKGNIYLKSSDGNISLSNATGNSELITSDGNIAVSQATGDFTITSSDGNIAFNEMSGSLQARSSDGQIAGQIDKLTGTLSLRTSDGNIVVRIPKDIASDISMVGDAVSTNLPINGNHEEKMIKGTLNGGGINIELYAADGRVRLEAN
ncbi:MAG: DUF4097 domain-containing protein [Reichenbachiella sp.]